MRGRTFLVSGVLCVFLILSVSMLSGLVMNSSSQESLEVLSEPVLSSYIPHDRIDIQNDTALASFAVSGTGDPGTPYILEGWNITTINKHGILVEGTTRHFIIRDCWMKVGGAAGIRLVSLASNTATISNVVVTDSAYGCYVNSAGQADIEDCIFQNGAWGLYVISSTELDVINCTFFGNSINGIKAQTSTHAFFFENIFTGNVEGLYLEGCDGATLDSNTFVDDGLNLYFSDILGYTSVNLDGNTVNGMDIGYFVSETDTDYKEKYGQVFMIDCLRVTAKALNCSNSIYGAYLRWSSDCEITDSIFNNNHLDGVVILNCDNILSENVTIVGNEGMGYNIWLSDYVDVSYSNITSNAVGVSTGNSDFNRIDHCNISTNGDSISTTGNQNTTIENNTFTDNGELGLMVDPYGDTTIFGNVFINDGLTLYGSDVQSYLSNIPLMTENIVNGQPLGIIANLNDIEISEQYGQLIMINCTGVGVSSQNCSNTITGLSALYCSDLEITDCTFSDNKKNGINLIHSDDSSIIGTIGKSNERGIDLLDTTGISIFESTFESNQYGADIYQSTNIIVSECSFNQNLIHGFMTSDVMHLVLLTNDFSFNGDSGAFISNTQTTLVVSNQFYMNADNGLLIYLSDDVQVFRNWMYNNCHGVSVTDSDFLTFAYNIVLENQDYG
ncbi:MAG: right-handed parallel beta-helix repeat-containing protein, partial [Candidatus Thorarchaeota archaeon]